MHYSKEKKMNTVWGTVMHECEYSYEYSLCAAKKEVPFSCSKARFWGMLVGGVTRDTRASLQKKNSVHIQVAMIPLYLPGMGEQI